jgi:ABC-2 type transport system permease protein
MKAFDIALKDMTRSFRSAFALIFMFGVPLLITGMFYLMFGNIASSGSGFSVPATKVVIANLDQGGPEFKAVMAQLPDGTPANSLGEIVVSTLQDQSFASLIDVRLVDNAAAARSAVDSQQAGLAILIPADFSARFSDLQGQANLELYQDPTLTLGPSIVRSVLEQFTDGISGAKIAATLAVAQAGSGDPALIGKVMQSYLAASPRGDLAGIFLNVRTPTKAAPSANVMLTIMSLIMGGMTVFYAFFTGTSTAQSILREDEEGTLPRLFTTPTTQTTILGGKFLAVGLTVVVQLVVLLILGRLIFGIRWGAWLPVALVALGTILAASTFGLFLISLLKSSKQAGAVMGGVLTMTGMVGMFPVFTGGQSSGNSTLSTASLVVPQGWAVHGLIQCMNAAPLGDVALTVLVLVAMSIVFFTIGVLRFQRKYA